MTTAAAAGTAPEPFIPPKWKDLAPLLKCSAALWTILLVVAILRQLTDWILRSRNRRDAKSRNMYAKSIYTLSVYYKRFRMALSRLQLKETDLIYGIRLPRCLVGAFICAFYCINTHTKNVWPVFYFIQVVYGLVALLCLGYDFVYTPHPIVFLFRPGTAVECLTIPSLLLASNSLWLNLNFLQAYKILTLWYSLEQHQVVLRNASALTRHYTITSLELAAFVFVTACGVHFFELLGDPFESIAAKRFYITWANAFYFAVVTIMTVGYGDFVPFTFLGRVWIVVYIVRTAYLLIRETDSFFESELTQRKGIESYVETIEYNHVVVTGHIKWEFFRNFIVEFCQEPTNCNTKVVVLTATRTWNPEDWDKFITRDVFYDYRVLYVEGSPLEDYDLERARVVSARAVFVFSDPHRGDPYDEDAICLKSILAIRKYGGNVPIFTFNISENSNVQFSIAMEQDEAWLGDHQLPSIPSHLGAGQYEPASGGGILDQLIADNAHEGARLVTRESTSLLENHSYLWHDPDDNEAAMFPEKKRSGVSLCTQELEMALLAENVYCNGLSTLLANLTLRFAPVPKPKDRLWLLEYKLGAQCSIQQLTIPSEFDGLLYQEVATFLQDYGIVLLAFRLGTENSWKIMTVDTTLKDGMSCMMITYHDPKNVAWIVERVLENFKPADSLDEDVVQSYPHSFDSAETSLRNRIFNPDRLYPERHELTRSHSQTLGFLDGSGTGGGAVGGGGGSCTRFAPLGTETNLGSRDPFSDDDGTDFRRPFDGDDRPSDMGPAFVSEVEQPAFTLGGLPTVLESGSEHRRDTLATRSSSRSDSTRDSSAAGDKPSRPRRKRKSSTITERSTSSSSLQPRFYSVLHQITETLTDHVIVCLDGEHSLKSLKVLLENLWKKRKQQRRRTKVVVIHPNFPKNFDREIADAGGDLYLLRGHSLSVQTLQQAQYKTSRGMLILASEHSGDSDSTRNTDSKAIFTVMTLDSLTDRRRLFVCCMLDAEDSLRLMRAPRHTRRIAFSREDSGSVGDERRAGPIPRSYSGNFLASMHGINYGSIATRESFDRNHRPTGPEDAFQSRGSNLADTLGYEDAAGIRDDLLESSDSNRTEQVVKTEGELCERQRYASGEMIISSLYAALLVREEAQPGFIGVLRTLLGLCENGESGVNLDLEGDDTHSSSARASARTDCWVRLLAVPESWTAAALPDARTYRETALRLQRLGVVPIGLYRSGSALVRYMRSEKNGSFERSQEGVSYNETERTGLLGGTRTGAAFRFSLQAAFERVRGEALAGARTGGSPQSPGPNYDERQFYRCPSTGRIIEYAELTCDNMLPYVYCFPEPYTVVDANDGVFVVCSPDKVIPTEWSLPK